ncbi:hypothetical protein HYT23_01090 [Candidatus Pacearchaeota archaeon]|nr:hypothetical protein [Candidatus Pacearchaeota archaeon]
MPITLCDMIHQDSIQFIERIDSSKIKTLAEAFPKFVLNGEPMHNDSVTFIGYKSRDSLIELGASIWASGQRTIGLHIRKWENHLGWVIAYMEKQDSAGQKYFADRGFVVDYIEVTYAEDIEPLKVEGETILFNTEAQDEVLVKSKITSAGAGDRAIFKINSDLREILSRFGQVVFDRTREIIKTHKNGEWLKR